MRRLGHSVLGIEKAVGEADVSRLPDERSTYVGAARLHEAVLENTGRAADCSHIGSGEAGDGVVVRVPAQPSRVEDHRPRPGCQVERAGQLVRDRSAHALHVSRDE